MTAVVLDFLSDLQNNHLVQTRAMRALKKLTKDKVEALVLAFDENKNGKIERDEFAEFCKFSFVQMFRTMLSEMGEMFDEDGEEEEGPKVDTDAIVADITADMSAAVKDIKEGEYTGPAPFMHEYHMQVLKMVEDQMSMGPEAMFEMMTDPKKQEEAQKKGEAFNEELKVLIQKSFELHDSKKDNVLDKEEAALFFEHFVSEFSLMCKAVARLAGLTMIKMQIQMMASGLENDEEAKGFTEHMKEQIKGAEKQIDEKVGGMMEDYKNNRAERDAAAFAVTDTNGDGTLCLDEAIAVLTPGNPLNDRFIAALGIQMAM